MPNDLLARRLGIGVLKASLSRFLFTIERSLTAIAPLLSSLRNRSQSRDLLLFLSLAVVVTWPLALQFASAAPGAERWQGDIVFVETPVNIWNLWWFRHATVDLGQSPFTGTQTFYPAGANLWLHTLAPRPAALAIPLQSVMTLTATYNTLVLAALCFAGLAAAALARELGQPPGAARVAGAIYMCAPVVMARLYAGHFELLWIGWIPLALRLFLRLLRADQPGWRDAVLLGVTIAFLPVGRAIGDVDRETVRAVGALVWPN